ncbi:MAG: LysR family transcriptional regulator [Kofleriaceae bacterium]|jgi:DNA-binding transcriptional LysR family regulator|nr:LysR family transcriptional regulator [Kofleriaceae bacterium]MBP6840327.1 LysR family transcriptional regulator [Kofleriaceae bacterium]MBP9203957.1 LysR family transcriptional regulator [Kofleriaceae bacterium]
MDLNELVVFAKVVETNSFTAAGDELGLPKSTVSRKIAQLEERLGVRLLQRTTRKLALTQVGQLYYERCQRIVNDIAAAERLVTDMQESPRGLLRVTAPVDLSASQLGPVLASFATAHPDIQIDLDASDRMVDLIEEGVDVALRFGPLPQSSLVARKLFSLRMFLVAAPSYLATRPPLTRISQLPEHDLILFSPNSRLVWSLSGPTGTVELAPPARFVSNSLLAALDLAVAGGGITLVPEFLCPPECPTAALRQVLPDWQTEQSELYAVYPSTRNLSPKVRAFLDHCVAAFATPPWRQRT